MPKTKVTLLSQLLQLVDRDLVNKLISKHKTNKHSKGIGSWSHLVSMIFLQLSGCSSLRDVCNGLRSTTGNFNHLGAGRAPGRSSLSYLNKHRKEDFFKELYFSLLEKLEPSLQRSRAHARQIKRKVFIMDASIIPLCLSLFDWARFQTKKGALKLHAVLDYDTGLPHYASLSDGKTSDIKAGRTFSFPSGSVVVVDRAYVDYAWLNNLDSNGVIFVTRIKQATPYDVTDDYNLKPKEKHIEVDWNITLTGNTARKKYPKKLRLVWVYDDKNDKMIAVLTNQMSWTASTIAQLYKARWDVEVFFKHMKQLFRIKSFVGTSENAVRIQMWTAMITILLLKYLKNKAEYEWGLSNLVSFVRLNLFVKINLWRWVNKPFLTETDLPPPQGRLF